MYSELELGFFDGDNLFKFLSYKEIANIIPNYNKKKFLDECVPQKLMWHYLRATWIKSDCKFMMDSFEKRKSKKHIGWSKKEAYEQLKNINIDAVSFIESIWGKSSTLYKEAIEIMNQSN